MKHVVRYTLEVTPATARHLLDEWLRLSPDAELGICSGNNSKVSFWIEVDVKAGGVLSLPTRQYVAAVVRCQGMNKRLRYGKGNETRTE